MIMVHTNNSSLGDDAPSVSTVLNRSGEEFPREETEIVGLRKVRTVVGTAGAGAAEFSPDIRTHRRRSARFSLFHWFKKANPDELETGNKAVRLSELRGTANSTEEELQAIENCGNGLHQIYSSSGSVDTNCSTATVHSFTFRPGADIDRRRYRFRRQFDSDPSINGENSVCENDKEKLRGVSSISAAEIDVRDKEVAPVSKDLREKNSLDKSTFYNYRSLPTSGKTADLSSNKKRLAHVRGKRRAPKPPGQSESSGKNEANHHLQGIHNTARRKRRAPEPPKDKDETGFTSGIKTCNVKTVTNGLDDTAALITNALASSSMLKTRTNDKQSSEKPLVISNDTLKLEGGVLLAKKSSKEVKKPESVDMSHLIMKQESSESVKKPGITNQTSNTHVAPRPWYKRSNTTLSERDICGSFRRDVLKMPTLSKSRDKSSRFSHHENSQGSNNESTTELVNSFDKSFSRLNHFFGRNEKRDDPSSRNKKDEKRKSNLSILTNISELDREAAAIVQEEQARNQAILSRSFPTAVNDAEKTTSGEIISDLVSSSIEPQRRGTRALISKFNAISNITKVTVNATFFAKSSANQSAKIDIVRGERVQANDRNDRIVTKRLLYDGAEQVNETDDVSSINFFRRLEAEASQTPQNDVFTATGWEEKIKRYFPERTERNEIEKRQTRHSAQQFSSPVLGKETSKDCLRQRQSKNVDQAFEFIDHRNARRAREAVNVDKIEHLSRADLKEMLIEMKHSLPKRPKQKSLGKLNPVVNNEKFDNVRKIQRSGLNDEKSKDTTSNRLGKLEMKISPEGVTKVCSVNEIIPVVDKTKVSSAAQTSANLRKVELLRPRERELNQGINNPRSKPSGLKLSEDSIYTTKVKKNPGGEALSRNTFQLIRPRDFACIEALKTGKGPPREAQNTYMNVIEDSIYANTVIYPLKISGENLPRESGSQNIDKSKNIGDDNVDSVQHYTANVVADIKIQKEPPKPESQLLPSEIIEGAQEKMPSSETNMNTVAINRLLRKLEGAIASGQHQQAAGLAKELAQLKIHCSVVRQRSGSTKASDFINVDMYIEDKSAHQGPIPLQLSLNMTVADLKKKVFAEFEIPANVQRWIIGKNLADDDDFTLNELKAVDKSSIFLYLVAPDLQNDECTRADKVAIKEEVAEVLINEEPHEIEPIIEEEPETIPQEEPTVEELKLKRYEHLMSLENTDVIPNSVPIECPICFAPYGPCEGVILRDCLHMFCRACIANTIMYCEEAEVKCPFRDSEYTCESTLQEREIKALVTPEIYEQHLAKSVSQAENNAGNNAFHCKTPDCPGWCIYDDNVNVFLCPVCDINNCLTCQAIHTNKNCREYQDELRLLKETDQETKRTAAVLEEMVESGEALACPTCAVVLMKKWGCDWLRCSMCKTEICWVTRGPRWGPAGKGDTSGGCKCGENGVKCHPRCNYCH